MDEQNVPLEFEEEDWMLDLGNLSIAVVVDAVTGGRLNLAVREDEDSFPRWYKRTSKGDCVPTEIHGEQLPYRRDCRDDDEFIDEFEEACHMAETELFMVIGLMPRYTILDDWCSQESLRERQALADDADQETVDATLVRLFGTTELF